MTAGVSEIAFNLVTSALGNQYLLNNGTKGYLHIASIYNSHSAQSTDNVYNTPPNDRYCMRALVAGCNNDFYRAMLCIRGTSHAPVSVSVCLSVCLSQVGVLLKRLNVGSHDSPGTLVFWCQRSPRNSTGVTPYEGAECRWGGSKSATFDKYPVISRKR